MVNRIHVEYMNPKGRRKKRAKHGILIHRESRSFIPCDSLKAAVRKSRKVLGATEGSVLYWASDFDVEVKITIKEIVS